MRSEPNTTPRGFKVWQLVVAVGAMGLTMRIALGSLPMPEPGYNNHPQMVLPAQDFADRRHYIRNHEELACTDSSEPVVEVLPFNMHGEVPGPLLADILQRYLPESTEDQASDLRDTLPPGADPRMIVILPEEEKPGYY